MVITQKLTLDVARDGVQGNVILVQGERGSRAIAVTLRCGKVPIALGSGQTAALRGIKPDGGELFNACVVYTEKGAYPNTILYHVTEGTVAAAGTYTVRLTIWNVDGDILWSPEFSITVKDNASLDSEVGSQNEFTALIDAAAQAQRAALEVEEQAKVVKETADRSSDLLASKQDKYDEGLETEDKQVAGAINELLCLLGKTLTRREADGVRLFELTEQGVYHISEDVAYEDLPEAVTKDATVLVLNDGEFESVSDVIFNANINNEIDGDSTVIPVDTALLRNDYEIVGGTGDLNGDGVVNFTDALYLYRHLSDPEGYPLSDDGDVNGDGLVDVNDVIALVCNVWMRKQYPTDGGDTKVLIDTRDRCYQFLFEHTTGKTYVRSGINALNSSDWTLVGGQNGGIIYSTLKSCSLDTVVQPGIYFLKTSQEYTETPTVKGGVMIAFNDRQFFLTRENRIYQVIIEYQTARVFLRGYRDEDEEGNTVFTPWRSLAFADDIPEAVDVSMEPMNLFDGVYMGDNVRIGDAVPNLKLQYWTSAAFDSVIRLPILPSSRYAVIIDRMGFETQSDTSTEKTYTYFKIATATKDVGTPTESSNSLTFDGSLQYTNTSAVVSSYVFESGENDRMLYLQTSRRLQPFVQIVKLSEGEEQTVFTTRGYGDRLLRVNGEEVILKGGEDKVGNGLSFYKYWDTSSIKSGHIVIKDGDRVVYDFMRVTDSSDNLDTWRWYGVSVDGVELFRGSDCEGVIKQAQTEDFIGGFHGNEVYTGISVLVDGETIGELQPAIRYNCKSIVISVSSDIYFWGDTANVAFKRIKRLSWEGHGLRIRNTWTYVGAEDFLVSRCTVGGCFSVYDSAMTGFTSDYDNAFTDVETGQSNTVPWTRDIGEVTFFGVGGFTVRVKTHNGDAAAYLGTVSHFADTLRYKVYFDNINAAAGEVLLTGGDVVRGDFEVEILAGN